MFYGQCDKCGERWELGTASTCTCVTKREWQGLTDDEVIECMKTVPLTSQDRVMGYIRAVEQRLKEKNT